MKKVRDIMRPGFLFTVEGDASVADAVHVMATYDVGIVSVLEKGRLVGVFSERDVVRRVVNEGLIPSRTRVGDVMTTSLIFADADEDYQSAIGKMDDAGIRHLPVISQGHILSMISIRDLLRVERKDTGEELRYLREYLYQVPEDTPVTP